jgi:hypothetical protein
MLKRYFRTGCFSLATAGALFFAANVYSNENGVIADLPQLDAPSSAGRAVIGNTATTSKTQTDLYVHQNASSSGANKKSPTSESNQKVERDFFRAE